MGETRFVPVSLLPSLAQFDFENPEHRISWDFTLPPRVDEERIAIDMRALTRVQTMAAFRSNHVRDYIGDRSEYEVAITGINADGTATAGRAKLAKKAETSQTNLQDDFTGEFGETLMKNYFKTSPTHNLNKPELSSRVVDVLQNRDIPREKAWANELNDSVVQSMNSAARKHLILRENMIPRIIDSAFISGYSIMYAVTNNSIEEALAHTATWSVILGAIHASINSAINKMLFDESFIADRRWSLHPFGNWQPDRYLATVALNSVSPLIRYRK